VIVVHRFIGRTVVIDAACQGVGGILAEGDGLASSFMTEITGHRLPHDRGQARAPAPRLVQQLLVRVLRQPEIRRGVLRHDDTTVPQYRGTMQGIRVRIR
jgi:hypothetical protein